MSKEKQIEEIFNIIVDGVIDGEDNNGVPTGNTCLNIAEHLYNAGYRKQGEWISVDERLPENDYGKHWKERQYYLVMTEPSGLMRVARYGYKEYGWWVDGHSYVLDERNYKRVTHWMPLPEAPKGGE